MVLCIIPIIIFLVWQIGAVSYARNEKGTEPFWEKLFVGEIIGGLILTFPIWIWFVNDLRG